jgi:hypothetical protein
VNLAGFNLLKRVKQRPPKGNAYSLKIRKEGVGRGAPTRQGWRNGGSGPATTRSGNKARVIPRPAAAGEATGRDFASVIKRGDAYNPAVILSPSR